MNQLQRASTLLPAACCLALGARGLGTPMPRDELATWQFSRLKVGDLTTAVDHVDRVLLPYYLLIHAWRTVSDSPGWLRVLSLLAAAVTVYLATGLASRFWGRQAGLVAGFGLALNPAFIDDSTRARPYALALLATTAATAVIVRATSAASSTTRSWALYAALAVAAAIAHLFATFMLIPHLLWVALSRSRESIRRFAAAGGLAALAALAVAAAVHTQSDQVSWIPALSPSWIVNNFATESGGRWFAALAPLCAVAVVWSMARERRLDAPAVLALGLWLTPVLCLVALSLIEQPVVFSDYMIAAPLGAALLLGAAVGLGQELLAKRGANAELLLVASLVLVVALAAPKVLRGPLRSHDVSTDGNNPTIADFLANRTTVGDLVAINQPPTATGFAFGLAYYADDRMFMTDLDGSLVKGQPTAFFRKVTGRSPLRMRAAAPGESAGTVWIVELAENGLADRAPLVLPPALGCRQQDSVEAISSGDTVVERVPCQAQ
jgi:hypothetical protein